MYSTMEKYVDQILDRFGHEGDKVFYEIFLQNNLVKFSDITTEVFEEIYYSLFDDNISKLIKLKEDVSDDFDIEEFDEYVGIILNEIVYSAGMNYSYVRFLAEVPKEQWNDIIKENLEGYQKLTPAQRIYNFYKDKALQENNK